MSELQKAKEEYERDFDPLSGGLYIGELEKVNKEYEKALIFLFKKHENMIMENLHNDVSTKSIYENVTEVLEKHTGKTIEELIK